LGGRTLTLPGKLRTRRLRFLAMLECESRWRPASKKLTTAENAEYAEKKNNFSVFSAVQGSSAVSEILDTPEEKYVDCISASQF
jgi:hypothetical protein